ncbi:hypothetical protein JKY72_06730 [Candidatus Gracilibacteria bacterium]|nr:hypothetical protein [Candidatus Gracilibacteria bacterium]
MNLGVLDQLALGQIDPEDVDMDKLRATLDLLTDENRRRIECILEPIESLKWFPLHDGVLEECQVGDRVGELIDNRGRVAYRLTASTGLKTHASKLSHVTKANKLTVEPVHKAYSEISPFPLKRGQYHELTEETLRAVLDSLFRVLPLSQQALDMLKL